MVINESKAANGTFLSIRWEFRLHAGWNRQTCLIVAVQSAYSVA
jgi:transposase